MTGLAPQTRYFVRAYAANAMETVYGEQQAFTTQAFKNLVMYKSGTGGGNGHQFADRH